MQNILMSDAELLKFAIENGMIDAAIFSISMGTQSIYEEPKLVLRTQMEITSMK